MKTDPHFIITAILVFLLMLFADAAYGDLPVHAAPELSRISVTTSMETQGIVVTDTSANLQLGTDLLNNPPLENGGILSEWFIGPDVPLIIGYTLDPVVVEFLGPAPPGEVQVTAGYHEETIAVSGNSRYVKTMSVDTGNKPVGEDNIAARTLVTFTGGVNGRMTTGENILVDGTGAQTVSENQAFCPFTGEEGPFFPPFCNIIMSGSTSDLSTGSISTSAGARVIAASADVPVSEAYLINAKGMMGPNGYMDANGSVNAFIKAHLQDGIEEQIPRLFETDPLGFAPAKGQDIMYSETSTATGSIHSFAKDMRYQSGIGLGT